MLHLSAPSQHLTHTYYIMVYVYLHFTVVSATSHEAYQFSLHAHASQKKDK